MNRHRAYYPRDDAPLVDGDGFFRGVNMRMDPSQLTEGYVSEAVNKRFEDGVAKTRRGIQKLIWTNLNDAGTPPKPQPFGTVHGAGVFKDPDSVEWIIVAGVTESGQSKAWKCSAGAGASEIPLPADASITGRVNFVQCFNVMLMQRGEDQPTLVMNHITTGFEYIPDPTLGAGYVKIPDSDNAVFVLNRLFIPYNRDWVFPSEIMEYTQGLSEITSFRINEGSEDELVALYKFNDTTLIAAKERSVYFIGGLAGDDAAMTSNAFLDTVTTEYGCKAAKSFAQVGSDVWFLADRRGVCSIRQTEQNKMQAVDVPISRDIDPLIRRIAWDYADRAVAAYHDNKYYLAVPIDNPVKTGKSLVNVVYAYDGSGNGSAPNVEAGQWYYWSKGANDTTLVNGDETMSASGYFKAQQSTLTTTGSSGQNATFDLLRAYVGYNNAILIYDTLQQAWSGYDSGNAVDVVDFIKFQFLGATRLGFFDSFGFLNVMEHGFTDMRGYHNGSAWVTADAQISDKIKTRGYMCSDPGFKVFTGIELDVSTWNPSYTVKSSTDGVDRINTVKTVTKSRSEYYAPFDRPDYVTTNVNDDHGTENRQDYSVDSSGNMYADTVSTENGIDPDKHQTVTERMRVSGQGKYMQLTIEGSQGRCEIIGARVFTRPGQRKLGTLS
jgi:hypothetical protein